MRRPSVCPTIRRTMLLLTFVICGWLWGGAKPAAAADEADAHLAKLAERLKGAEAFATQFDFRMTVGLPGLSHNQTLHYKLAVQRPREFALIPRGAEGGPSVVANAEGVTTYLAQLNQYTQRPAPESLDAYSQSLGAMMLLPHGMGHLVASLLADHPDQRLIADSSERKYLGREQIEGIDCHHLRIVEELCDYDLWITAGPEPKLRRIRPDISKSFGEEEREAGFLVTMVIEFTEWDFASQHKPETFKFTPPQGAKLVEQFAAIVPEGVLPPIASVHPLIGKPAPKFALEGYEQGDALKLDEVLGKQVVVLDFWAIFCPPCIEGLPLLQEVAQDFKNKEVVVRAVNLDDSRESIRKFLKEHQLKLPVLLDPKAKVAESYRVEGIPQTVLIGKDGRVHVVYEGLSADFKADLTRDINALLAGEDLAAKALARPEPNPSTPGEDRPEESNAEEPNAEEPPAREPPVAPAEDGALKHSSAIRR